MPSFYLFVSFYPFYQKILYNLPIFSCSLPGFYRFFSFGGGLPQGTFAELVAPATHLLGAPPQTPGDFLPDEKVTKESPRRVSPLGTPLKGTLRSPCSTLCCYPLKRVSATDPDRFATLSERANWSCFLPTPYKGHTFSCQSVARQVLCFRGCLGSEGRSALLGVAETASLGRSKSYFLRRSAAATGLGIEKTKTIANAMATAILMVSIPLNSAIALSPMMK